MGAGDVGGGGDGESVRCRGFETVSAMPGGERIEAHQRVCEIQYRHSVPKSVRGAGVGRWLADVRAHGAAAGGGGRGMPGCGGREGVGRGGDGGGGMGTGVRRWWVGEGRPPSTGGLRLVADGRRVLRVVGRGVCRYGAGLTVRGSLARRPSRWPIRQHGLGAGRSPGGPADQRRGGRAGGGRASGGLRRDGAAAGCVGWRAAGEAGWLGGWVWALWETTDG